VLSLEFIHLKINTIVIKLFFPFKNQYKDTTSQHHPIKNYCNLIIFQLQILNIYLVFIISF